ncbi:IPExxxVDY family protein, partial [Flavobacterium sp. FPG59]|uniref:IPExxxVDY family protein n=2 Tax=unclassified Flavobacterium TaxID=196869 RepID=UPI000B6DBF4B
QKEFSQNLFSDIKMDVATKVFLLPEFKKVDYFFKIENTDDTLNLNEIKTLLNTINNVSAVYSVETTKIKSKNNLIF